MFERYTEKARQVIFSARDEAVRFDAQQIEAEYLLLGIAREEPSLLGELFAGNANYEFFRSQISVRGHAGKRSATSKDLKLSNESKRGLAYGAEEARQLGDKYIRPEHLLLGILREKDCFAAQLLRDCGAEIKAARKRVAALSPQTGLDDNSLQREVSAPLFRLLRKIFGSRKEPGSR